MLHLSTFFMLLALTVAQNGYEYNKPRQPFPMSSSRPGFSSGTSGGYPSTTSYPGRQPNDDYSGDSSPGFPSGPSNFPNQGFPGSSSQRPQIDYPGQGPSYQGPDGYQGGQSFGSNFGLGSSSYRPSSSGFGQGSEDTGEYEGGDYSAIPGQPDIDYPILSYIPSTSFSCESQAYPGYYGDVETRCQVFHICANNKTYDFLCPNGTIFSQEVFVCVWWDQFDCESSQNLYALNANLYDYSITGSQGFSGNNDYSQGSYSGGRPQSPSSYPRPGQAYPGSSGPSTSYPATGFPGSSRPSGPGRYPTSTPYPESNGSYPGTGPGSPFPGSVPNFPGSNSGYPSGKPSGPGFPTGNGRPVQTPNREYLPPN